MSPYVQRGILPHRCDTPAARSPDPDSPIRGDVWDCPGCGRRYYCVGWHEYFVGHQFPSWHRVPRAAWWPSWVLRLIGSMRVS